MAEEQGEAGAASAPSGGGGGSKIGLIISVLNLLLTVGVIAVLFQSLQKEKEKASVEDIAAEQGTAPTAEGEEGKEGEGQAKAENQHFGKMISLEQFTVNLSTAGSVQPKFARVNISIEVPSEEIEVEVSQKMPKVRNTIIDVFNSKRPNDLATVQGRSYVKDEIRNALNDFLITGKIKGVFFTSFALSG